MRLRVLLTGHGGRRGARGVVWYPSEADGGRGVLFSPLSQNFFKNEICGACPEKPRKSGPRSGGRQGDAPQNFAIFP